MPSAASKKTTKPRRIRVTFTEAEDEQIWTFLWKSAANGQISSKKKPTQTSFWRSYIESSGSKRTDVGLATHFRNKLLPNLHNAPMSTRVKGIISYVYKLAVHPRLRADLSEIATSLTIDDDGIITRLLIRDKHVMPEAPRKPKREVVEVITLDDEPNFVQKPEDEKPIEVKMEVPLNADGEAGPSETNPINFGEGLLTRAFVQQRNATLDLMEEFGKRMEDEIKQNAGQIVSKVMSDIAHGRI